MKTNLLFTFRNGVPDRWITKVISFRYVVFSLFTVAFIAGCDKTIEQTSPLPSQNVAEKRSLPEFSGNPADFITGITNPYLAFTPGKIFHYEGETDEGTETILVEVTDDNLTILGIAVTVVRDRVFLNDTLIEDTFDWFAEDTDGNVWYFGEDSKEILNGQVVSTEGSWKAGENDAVPGIIMLAEPQSGMSYHQEFAPGVAEDEAKVLSLNKTVNIGIGTFEDCLETLEWTDLSPGGHKEHKYYHQGTGLVLERSPGGEPVELVGTE